MNSTPNPPDPTPAERLAKLRETVKHLEEMWTVVLQRLAYLQSMTSNDELHDALNQTRAAQVHNAIQDVLLGDLILQIAALILDSNSGSASVARAITMLRENSVLEELQASYRVTSQPARIYTDHELSAEARATSVKSIQDLLVRKSLEECAMLCNRLPEIETKLVKSAISEAIGKARKKAVAHYDLRREGADWKVWRISDVNLTYGQLIEYVEACTWAIDTLARLVRRRAHDFKGTSSVAEGYAAEYVAALVIGLHKQREQGEARLEGLSRQRNPGDT
jgi:hypothetical protein